MYCLIFSYFKAFLKNYFFINEYLEKVDNFYILNWKIDMLSKDKRFPHIFSLLIINYIGIRNFIFS